MQICKTLKFGALRKLTQNTRLITCRIANYFQIFLFKILLYDNLYIQFKSIHIHQGSCDQHQIIKYCVDVLPYCTELFNCYHLLRYGHALVEFFRLCDNKKIKKTYLIQNSAVHVKKKISQWLCYSGGMKAMQRGEDENFEEIRLGFGHLLKQH